jgi:hypothetical protein
MRRRGIGRPAQPSLVNTVSGKAASNKAAKAQQSATGTAAPAAQPQPDATSAPTPAAASLPVLSDDAYDQLKKLGELRDAGILTDDEFQAKKNQILGL